MEDLIMNYFVEMFKYCLDVAQAQGKKQNDKNFIYGMFQNMCVAVKEWSIESIDKQVNKLMQILAAEDHIEKNLNDLNSFIMTVLKLNFAITSIARPTNINQVKIPKVDNSRFVYKCYCNVAIDVARKQPPWFDTTIIGPKRLEFYSKAKDAVAERLQRTITELIPLKMLFTKSPKRSPKTLKTISAKRHISPDVEEPPSPPPVAKARRKKTIKSETAPSDEEEDNFFKPPAKKKPKKREATKKKKSQTKKKKTPKPRSKKSVKPPEETPEEPAKEIVNPFEQATSEPKPLNELLPVQPFIEPRDSSSSESSDESHTNESKTNESQRHESKRKSTNLAIANRERIATATRMESVRRVNQDEERTLTKKQITEPIVPLDVRMGSRIVSTRDRLTSTRPSTNPLLFSSKPAFEIPTSVRTQSVKPVSSTMKTESFRTKTYFESK